MANTSPLQIIEALGSERMAQIRRAHASARPRAESPAWMNCHTDMAYMLQQIEAALALARTMQDSDAEGKQPLSVERIEQLWDEFMSGQGSGYVPDFVRAIERAHGISPPVSRD